MGNYEQLQAERNKYGKQARIAKRKGDTETAEKAQMEVKFLNKLLRAMHKAKCYKK